MVLLIYYLQDGACTTCLTSSLSQLMRNWNKSVFVASQKRWKSSFRSNDPFFCSKGVLSNICNQILIVYNCTCPKVMSFPPPYCCFGEVSMYIYIHCINMKWPIWFKEMCLALTEVTKANQKTFKVLQLLNLICCGGSTLSGWDTAQWAAGVTRAYAKGQGSVSNASPIRR